MMRMITPLVAVPGSFLAGLCAPARALGSQRDSTAGSFFPDAEQCEACYLLVCQTLSGIVLSAVSIVQTYSRFNL